MGMTGYEIQQRVGDMEKLAQGILSHGQKIRELQSACEHHWSFHHQVNAYHDKIWHVMYKCDECSLVRTEKKEPVCGKCDMTLVRCDAGDLEAETERVKPEHKGHWNPAIAFRCSSCRQIHILWHEGD